MPPVNKFSVGFLVKMQPPGPQTLSMVESMVCHKPLLVPRLKSYLDLPIKLSGPVVPVNLPNPNGVRMSPFRAMAAVTGSTITPWAKTAIQESRTNTAGIILTGCEPEELYLYF
ncbi:unnamed protein product [Acanthoscelides obtectus]|uniref:Uncharacterized protein n=1 Tax=Acanthoscelides obtectus TaxID=200917 RepID=A0A9P0P3E8_ACAOB|nr:unnamed protein product [Acanthoscelides obtectus]CAK1633834.1 hypothetical protein AOBTE_LOCUS8421 [Acanthoscelides obtectus]